VATSRRVARVRLLLAISGGACRDNSTALSNATRTGPSQRPQIAGRVAVIELVLQRTRAGRYDHAPSGHDGRAPGTAKVLPVPCLLRRSASRDPRAPRPVLDRELLVTRRVAAQAAGQRTGGPEQFGEILRHGSAERGAEAQQRGRLGGSGWRIVQRTCV